MDIRKHKENIKLIILKGENMNKNVILQNVHNFRIMLIALIKGACNDNMKECMVLALDFLGKIAKSETTGMMIINLDGALSCLKVSISYCRENDCPVRQATELMCKSIEHLMKITELSPNESPGVRFLLGVINEGYSDSL